MEYPYYIVPDVEAYRKLDPHSEEAVALSRKIAANIGDYASLRLVLGIDPPEFAKFYPDMETASPSTMDTIDDFLDKFGSTASPTGYMANFTAEEPDIKQEENKNKNTPGIIRNLIKEGRYREAAKLIEAQNLNNPQKSIYFAHQMRFLRKLMAIDRYRNKNQG